MASELLDPVQLVALGITTRRFEAAAIAEKSGAIAETLLRHSSRVRSPNFDAIATDDLARLFALYDARFFEGGIRRLLDAQGAVLHFDLSRRLTRSAGQTSRRLVGQKGVHYKIALSTTILFQSFRGDERLLRANGVECRDRLAAALRVFEHELVHLIEFLLWADSSCAGARFQDLARNFFGHTCSGHELTTPAVAARERFALVPGDLVTFEHEGQTITGKLNRITRRATILVEDARGPSYSDGKRYRKFYVPLPLLKKVEAERKSSAG